MNLADLTTLRIGGPVTDLVECTTEQQLVAAARPGVFVLGGGSNVVMPDEGLDAVALVRTRGIRRDGRAVVVQAGEDWDELVAWTVAEGLGGLEALSGIPGTVGASPVQNVGAYGAEIASVVGSVRVLDRETGEVAELAAEDCGFRYRSSRFKDAPGRWVVLAVTFVLGEPTPVRYAELARVLDVPLGSVAPPSEVRQAVLALRRSKGMVLSADDPDSVSAGSFFTNPLVADVPPGAPSWPDDSGLHKVPAAWLIEHSGYSKGWGTGRIGLSSKHTLALVNRGGGTAEELLSVARQVRDGVRERFGISLVNEPVLVGATL
jgi:UDP-N-acetylmuramate dehydrogenase